MYAVNKLQKQAKIKKSADILFTREEVKTFRVSLERATEAAFKAFAEGKRKARKMAYRRCLD